MADSPATELMDTAAVAQLVGSSERFVRDLVSRREIPHLKIGKFVRFDREAIDAWLKASTRVEAPEIAS
jgi:excisionase family DNA binding protein